MPEDNSQLTQPATQQVLDPRRVGRNNSGLNDSDCGVVLVILHPATPTAIEVVANTAKTRPQHVLFRNPLDSFGHTSENIEEQETIILDANGKRLGQNFEAGADLALRTTSASTLRIKELGFVFGRNANSADIVFSQDAQKRISNQHFRIFLNPEGILMIEDMSTNGTIVDDNLLRCKDTRFSPQRTLVSGSVIRVQNASQEEMIKFIVRIPSRVAHLEKFRTNLRDFIAYCHPGEDSNRAMQRIGKHFGGATMRWDGGEKYSIVGVLGKGAFATVHQLAEKMTGRVLAAKELEKRRFMKNGQLDQKLDNEMKIMKGLTHDNIVKFEDYIDEADHIYILMEYVPHGDLQGYLQQHGRMPEPNVRSVAQQVLSALAYLHASRITHRDIKPDNLLISELEPFTVKISDFGLSKAIRNEDTFLKTFCGTLLYCAPEVFPDFKNQGVKRRRGAKQFHQYSSSVDVWSLAGVLWYALCGQPPFKGIADTTGEAMYRNIMATPLDATPLRNHGVSEMCIDLLTGMLRTDPELRPTAVDCLRHPWLRDGAKLPADPVLQSIVEEDEFDPAEKQLSQLSLGQGNDVSESFTDEQDEDVLYDDEFVDMLGSKRVRQDPMYPRNQIRDSNNSCVNPSFQSGNAVEEGESFRLMPQPPRPRLFGEIGQSAFQSSGFLNAHANDALSYEQSIVPAPYGGAAHEGYALGGAEGHASAIQGPPDGRHSSPSLQGAESMVRDMQMGSPESTISRTQSPAMPATPRTPDVIQHNSLDHGSNDPSQASEPTPKARPATMDRQINLPQTASYYYDPLDPTTHNLEYASRVSGFDFLAATKRDSEAGASAYADTVQASDDSHSNLSASAAMAAQSQALVLPTLPARADFRRPPKRLGKLVATPDSFMPGFTIHLEQSRTSFGRKPDCTVVHGDAKDTRISKTAFVISFLSDSANVGELVKQGEDWTKLDDLHTSIFTCASAGISINGTLLTKLDDKGRANWGQLHSGDVIQIYKDTHSPECLKLKCELYLGQGTKPRPVGSTFITKRGPKPQ